MEARAFAELPVVGLERFGRVRVVDDRVDPGPDLLHLLEVGEFHRLGERRRGEGLTLGIPQPDQQVADDVGPAVVHEVFRFRDPGHEVVEVLHPPRLPPWLERSGPFGVGRSVGAHVDRRRRALEHEQLCRARTEVRNTLHGGGPGADDADPFAFEAHEAALGITAGVVIVPPARVERVPPEAVDAGNAGELRPVQRPAGHADVAGAHRVPAVGPNDPAPVAVVPTHLGDLGLEARVAVQIEVVADGLAVGQDLRGLRVLLPRDVADLLEQRQVDVRLDVTGGTGIAVPVPRAAEVAALLDDPDVVDAGLAQSRPGEQASEAAADDQHLDLVEQRLAFDRLDVRIVDVVPVLPGDLDVLLVAVGAEPLVAFGAVLLAQRVGVELVDPGAHRTVVVVRPRRGRLGATRIGRARQ